MGKRLERKIEQKQKRLRRTVGKSSYAEKQSRARPTATSSPTSAPVVRKDVVVPPGTHRIRGTVCARKLNQGYVLLRDEQGRRVFVEDRVLQMYDPQFNLPTTAVIDCAVVENDQGLKAVVVFDISDE